MDVLSTLCCLCCAIPLFCLLLTGRFLDVGVSLWLSSFLTQFVPHNLPGSSKLQHTIPSPGFFIRLNAKSKIERHNNVREIRFMLWIMTKILLYVHKYAYVFKLLLKNCSDLINWLIVTVCWLRMTWRRRLRFTQMFRLAWVIWASSS